VLATFVYFVLPVILLCIGLPIYLILLIASLVAVVWVADVPLTTIQTNMFGGLDNFPLLAIPFFILAGEIMGQGGIARRVIVWGLVLIGLSSIAIGLSTEYWQLLAFLAVMGIASGTYHAPASALIAEMFSSRRGMAMGTHTTAGHLSFFAAPLVAGILATAGSWRTPYLAFAIAPIA